MSPPLVSPRSEELMSSSGRSCSNSKREPKSRHGGKETKNLTYKNNQDFIHKVDSSENSTKMESFALLTAIFFQNILNLHVEFKTSDISFKTISC